MFPKMTSGGHLGCVNKGTILGGPCGFHQNVVNIKTCSAFSILVNEN